MGIEELAYLAARVLSCGLWLIVGIYKIAHFSVLRGIRRDAAQHMRERLQGYRLPVGFAARGAVPARC